MLCGILIEYLNLYHLLKLYKVNKKFILKNKTRFIKRLINEGIVPTNTFFYIRNINYLACLKEFKKFNNLKDCDSITFENICYHNHMDCLKFLHENSFVGEKSCISICIRCDHFEMFKYLIDCNYDIDKWAFYESANYHNIKYLKYLFENCEFNHDYERLIYNSLQAKNLACFKYLINKYENFEWNVEISHEIVKKRNLKSLKYYISKGCPYDEKTFSLSIMYDKFETTKYLYSIGCKYNSHSYVEAIFYDRLKYVKYLHSIDCETDKTLMEYCAEHDSPKCLKYLYKNNFPKSDDVIYYASKYNNFECLKIGYNNECPWGKDTFDNICENGNIEMLEFVYNRGCKPTKFSLSLALLRRQEDCVLYLHNKIGLKPNECVSKGNFKYFDHIINVYQKKKIKEKIKKM